MTFLDDLAKNIVADPAIQRLLDEKIAYKEFYEAQQAWEAAQDPKSPNQDYLAAADRLRAARQRVKELRGE